MNLTMLCQVCRQGHFAAKVKEDPSLAKLADILFKSERPANVLSDEDMTDEAIQKFQLQGTDISIGDQKAMVLYLTSICHNPHHIATSFFIYKDGRSSLPLIPQGNMLHTFTYVTHTYSTYTHHQGNSAIHYSQLSIGHEYGFIQQIWQVPIWCQLHTFIFITTHWCIKDYPDATDIYAQYPELQCTVLAKDPGKNVTHIIEPTNIISHISVWSGQADAVGVQNSHFKEVYVVCDALDRGHHQW
jgi:hypothetical protein